VVVVVALSRFGSLGLFTGDSVLEHPLTSSPHNNVVGTQRDIGRKDSTLDHDHTQDTGKKDNTLDHDHTQDTGGNSVGIVCSIVILSKLTSHSYDMPNKAVASPQITRANHPSLHSPKLCHLFCYFINPRGFLQNIPWPHQSTNLTPERAASHMKVTHPPYWFQLIGMLEKWKQSNDCNDSG